MYVLHSPHSKVNNLMCFTVFNCGKNLNGKHEAVAAQLVNNKEINL